MEVVYEFYKALEERPFQVARHHESKEISNSPEAFHLLPPTSQKITN